MSEWGCERRETGIVCIKLFNRFLLALIEQFEIFFVQTFYWLAA